MRAIILDFDGTVLDTETPVYESWKSTYADHAVELPIELYGRCIGSSDDRFNTVQYLESSLGRSLDWEEINPKRRAISKGLLEKQTVLPGIVELLEQAKEEGIKLAIASSSPRDWVEPLLKKFGLLHYFETVVTLDDVEQPKPAPDLFQTALTQIGIDPEDAIAIEDSPNGCIAANAAGLYCVLIPNPVTRFLKNEHYDLMLHSLKETNLADLKIKLKNRSGKMKIRKATTADAESIASIIESVSELQTVADRGHQINVEVIYSNLERCQDAERSTAYVGESVEGEVLGYCTVHWAPFLFLNGGEAYITELFVRPDARSTGLGTALLEKIEHEARLRGCSRLSLNNGKASESYEREFYHKRGWTERDQMANFVFDLNQNPRYAED